MREENYGEISAMADYEYEEDKIDADFVESEAEDDFDYDGYRMHKYDSYEGELTVEIALVKFERLVRSLARKYEGRGAEYEELFQLGQMKLRQLVKENSGRKFLSNYLRRALGRYISYKAESIRHKERWDKKEDPILMETLTCTAVGYDWHEREVEMFRKLSALLTKGEMELLRALYQGASKKRIAASFKISRAIIDKRLEQLRQKITPLIPWLEDKMEFPCTEYSEN